MATLKDVAKLANVDVSTVSRALNNTSYVHPDTKKKIMAAVKKLSYHPNLLAQGLKKGKRHTIAVIVPSISSNVFSDITSEIERYARKFSYVTLIATTEGSTEAEAECLSRFASSLVDGIIIASTGQNNNLMKKIHAEGIPIIQIVRKQTDDLSSIISDYYENGESAVNYLYKKGCRHIGILHGNLDIMPFSERFKGYKKAMRSHKLAVNSYSNETRNITDYSSGYDGAKNLLENDPELDAVISCADLQCLGIMRYLSEQNISVPDQIKVISLTGIKLGEMLHTTITSNMIPAKEIGDAAVDMILKYIDCQKDTPLSTQHIIFQSKLVEREST